MSAKDIAGAVVWTPFALEGWRESIWNPYHHSDADQGGVMVLTIMFSLAAVYCVARLCGAKR